MKEPRICPSCGKSALPVATRCPGCGCAFELRYDRPAVDASPSRKGLVTAGALAVLALLGANGLRQWGGSDRTETHSAGMAAPPKAAPAPKPVVAAAPDSTPTRAERTPAPPVATVAVAVPAPAPAKPASTPATPPAPVTRIAAPAPARNERATVQGIARYASTWINVRSARSSQAPVVRVLKPGEAVHVDSLAEGWYQVVTTDAVQGYADRRLLSDEVPVNR